jgi:hypothetical protein
MIYCFLNCDFDIVFFLCPGQYTHRSPQSPGPLHIRILEAATGFLESHVAGALCRSKLNAIGGGLA